MTALKRLVLDPGRDPGAAAIPALVAAGVSREFIEAVHLVITDESVSSFSTEFEWAATIPAPRGIDESVEVTRDSAGLLHAMAEGMRSTEVEPRSRIAGPIVDWHYVDGEPRGYIGIQTVRQRREVIVRVWLNRDEVRRATDYLQGSLSVVVDGQIAGGRGNPLQILRPALFMSLDETMLLAAEIASLPRVREVRAPGAFRPSRRLRSRRLSHPPRTSALQPPAHCPPAVI